MSQRTEKVASIVHRSVAEQLLGLPESGRLTVTKVDISPDLRHAMVFIGVVARTPEQGEQLFDSVVAARSEIQAAAARNLSTKFVPRLEFEHDTGAEHADRISRLIKEQ